MNQCGQGPYCRQTGRCQDRWRNAAAAGRVDRTRKLLVIADHNNLCDVLITQMNQFVANTVPLSSVAQPSNCGSQKAKSGS